MRANFLGGALRPVATLLLQRADNALDGVVDKALVDLGQTGGFQHGGACGVSNRQAGNENGGTGSGEEKN